MCLDGYLLSVDKSVCRASVRLLSHSLDTPLSTHRKLVPSPVGLSASCPRLCRPSRSGK